MQPTMMVDQAEFQAGVTAAIQAPALHNSQP
jgi:hypothetical protein